MSKMQTKTHSLLFFLILLFFSLRGWAQQGAITGQVVDEKGESVIGATVQVKGTSIGSITDFDGNVTLQGQIGNTLVISYVGFRTLEVKVSKFSGNYWVLKENSEILDEVVVIGMGAQKRNTITAAVATVKSDAISARPVTDVTSALQGNVAGLNFSSDALGGDKAVGGETGAKISFNIRGIGSINGGEPYVLVDGVEQNLQNVNPADIESISILKDASASAIYGARAAYGVVLVTTKKGKNSKARVSYSGTVGISAPLNMPQMMNSLEYANYVNAVDDVYGRAHNISNKTIEKIKGFMNNPYSAEFPGIDTNAAGDGWAASPYSQYANTDWFDYYFRDASLRHSHNLNVQGGADKVNYYVGLGYTYQQGLLDQVDDDLKKYNMNTKLEIKPSDWLKLNFNNNITLQIINRPMANQTIFYGTIANLEPTRATQLPVENAEYAIPVWNEMLYLNKTSYNQTRISDAMTFSVTVTPLKGWDVIGEMKARFDVENNNYMMKDPKFALPNGQISKITGSKQGYQYPGMSWKNMAWGSYTRGNLFNYYLSPSINSSYTHQWGDHFFKAMAGYQMELQELSNGFSYKDGMLSNDIYSFNNSNGVVYVGENRDHWATMGFYTRLNWNYQNVYFLEFSGRYDGSSRFAPGNRWGLFPSFSAGYDIARTTYFQRMNLPMSQLKVRVSYGRLGNQNGAGYYDYLGVMRLDPSNPNAWLLPGGAAIDRGTVALTPKMLSPFITWEKVDNANLGLDMMLFEDRLSVTFDIYQRMTKDMIGPAEAIPAIGGIASSDRAKVNNATLRNRGWELAVHWQDKLKCGFTYGVGFNVFDYKAVVTKYNNPSGIIYNNHTGLAANKGYYEGMDVGEIWGFVADDLFMSNAQVDDYLGHVDLGSLKPADQWQRGDLMFVDSDGNGRIDWGDGTLSNHGDLRIIGNTTPRYSFGINFNLGYKGISVSGLFQGVAKRDYPMAGSSYLFGQKNFFKEHLDYWSPSNPDAYLPRLADFNSKDYQVNTGYNTTRYMLNAAYLRMKNLMVAYTFNRNVTKTLGLENLRVYFTCDNLFTLSKLPSAFDPETINQVNGWAGGSNATAPGLTSALTQNGNGKVYPMNRNFVFGVDFTF